MQGIDLWDNVPSAINIPQIEDGPLGKENRGPESHANFCSFLRV